MKHLGTLALGVAAFVAVVAGGIALLALLPLLGLVWGIAEWLWLIGWPVFWWRQRGKAPRPATPAPSRTP